MATVKARIEQLEEQYGEKREMLVIRHIFTPKDEVDSISAGGKWFDRSPGESFDALEARAMKYALEVAKREGSLFIHLLA